MRCESICNAVVTGGDDHGEAGRIRGPEHVASRQTQHDWLAAKDLFRHGGHTLYYPALAEIVVSDEDAVGLQHPLDVLKGFTGEEITFQSNIGVAAMQNEGIDEGS